MIPPFRRDGRLPPGVYASNLLDPIFLDFSNRRQAQKDRFHGEFFPAEFPAGSGMTYLEFFQTEKDTARRKGIISLRLEELP